MEYVRLGRSGLEVSRLCVGAMGFGIPGQEMHGEWVIDEEAAAPVVQRAVEAGINFFDTANVYGRGSSEVVLGKLLKTYANRDELVLATKVNGRMHDGPNGAGLSRKMIMSQIDASLQRLGTDYVDLYIIHRWDPNPPIEETMSALNDVVRAGKVRYLGASAMYAWQFLSALHVADINGWERFVSMQDHYNLLYREEEREMLPLCRAEGVGSTPYSPLASGRLARDWDATSARAQSDQTAMGKYDSTKDQDRPIVEAVGRVAERLGTSRAAVALAWLLSRDPVVAPIIGATRTDHIDSALEALEVELSPDDIAELEAPYQPHQIVGHS